MKSKNAARYVQTQIKRREVLSLTTSPGFELKHRHFINKSFAVSSEMPEESLCLQRFLEIDQNKQALCLQWQTKPKIVGTNCLGAFLHLNDSSYQIFAFGTSADGKKESKLGRRQKTCDAEQSVSKADKVNDKRELLNCDVLINPSQNY